MRKFKPYIGITGFENAEQATKMCQVLSANCAVDRDRRLMVGVMMNRETLNGQPSEWTDVWPDRDEIRHIFTDHHRAMNTIHYVDDRFDDLLTRLTHAAGYGGYELDAIQIDVPWPDVDGMMTFCDIYRHLQIVLQLNTVALKMAGDDPATVVRWLSDYNGAVDCVLLDKSEGQGKPLNPDELLPFLRAIRTHIPDLSLAVAGGLGPDTLHFVEPFFEEFPDISLDACGQLHQEKDQRKPLDPNRSELYIQRATQLCTEALI
ncbi:MAG: hypothetical protein U9Q03_04630 [Patescibacteria group bacterium]|nr:hypothetical protein [Patescibacteria group bacterium]